jgi:hypothetical protein
VSPKRKRKEKKRTTKKTSTVLGLSFLICEMGRTTHRTAGKITGENLCMASL